MVSDPAGRHLSAEAAREALDELVVPSRVDEDAIDCHADLALVHGLAEQRGIDGAVEIGVVEHDERAVPPSSRQTRLTPRPAGSPMRRPTASSR